MQFTTMQGKQAKTVSPTQERAIVGYLDTTRYPARDRVMFLLWLFLPNPRKCKISLRRPHATGSIVRAGRKCLDEVHLCWVSGQSRKSVNLADIEQVRRPLFGITLAVG